MVRLPEKSSQVPIYLSLEFWTKPQTIRPDRFLDISSHFRHQSQLFLLLFRKFKFSLLLWPKSCHPVRALFPWKKKGKNTMTIVALICRDTFVNSRRRIFHCINVSLHEVKGRRRKGEKEKGNEDSRYLMKWWVFWQ